MYFTNKYTKIAAYKGIYLFEWKKIEIHKRYEIWMNKMENAIKERIDKIQNINQKTRFLTKVDLVKKVYKRLNDNPEWTIKDALVDVALNSSLNAIKKVSISRTRFFEMQEIIFTTLAMNIALSRRGERCFSKLMPKSTAPKNPKCKYSSYLKLVIAQFYDDEMHKTGINVCDLTLALRQGRIVLCGGREDVSKISEPTVRNALETYSKVYRKVQKRDNYVFRLKPYQLLKLGRVQLDVKYLTPSFTGLPHTIYWIDMKDEASKVIYAEVSTTQSARAINQMIINGIKYFKERFGIKIVRIQTDHCNSFKEVKIAKDHGFQLILKTYGIHHRYCIFQRPETNGVIERHHSTVRRELRVAMKIAGKGGITQIQDLCSRYVKRFNFGRFHTYTYRLHSKVIKEYHIPFERLVHLKSLDCNQNIVF